MCMRRRVRRIRMAMISTPSERTESQVVRMRMPTSRRGMARSRSSAHVAMSRPLVISVTSDVVRGAIRGRTGIVWQREVERSAHRDLADVIAELLRAAPSPRIGTRRALAVVGPSAVQLKQLVGLPSLQDPTLLTRIVRESVSRFFLVHAALPVTTSVHRDSRGRLWCAAFDGATLEALTCACDAARVRLLAVAPVVSLLPRILGDGVHVWSDGAIHVELEASSGALTELKRCGDGVSIATGEGTVESVDLQAAEQLSPHAPLAWRPKEDERRARRRRWRGATVTALALAAGVAAFIAPTARVIRSGTTARSEVDSLIAVRNRVAQNTAALSRVTQDVDLIQSFAAERRPVTFLLRDLTIALPESTAIVSIRIDSAGGSISAVAPHAADIIPALTGVDGIVLPRLVGAITREMVGSVRLERAAIRFRLPDQSRETRPSRRSTKGRDAS